MWQNAHAPIIKLKGSNAPVNMNTLLADHKRPIANEFHRTVFQILETCELPLIPETKHKCRVYAQMWMFKPVPQKGFPQPDNRLKDWGEGKLNRLWENNQVTGNCFS